MNSMNKEECSNPTLYGKLIAGGYNIPENVDSIKIAHLDFNEPETLDDGTGGFIMDKNKMANKLKKMLMESELKGNDKKTLVHTQGYTITEIKGGKKEDFNKLDMIDILSNHFNVLDAIIKDMGEDNIKMTYLNWTVLSLGSFLPVSGNKIDITIEFFT
jgi:hypothetical protein